MEPIRLFVRNKKIHWGMPIDNISYFSEELNSSIPFNMYGEKETCRYEHKCHDIPLYISPVFDKKGLVLLRATFEEGEDLARFRDLVAAFTADYGKPAYERPSISEHNDLVQYPCVIWVLEDSILEVGVHMDRKFTIVGYLHLTHKDNYRFVYSEDYLSNIGWKLKKL